MDLRYFFLILSPAIEINCLGVISHNMIFVPEGFAHGYLVLEQDTIVQYKCTNYYSPSSEYGILRKDIFHGNMYI